MAGLYKIIQIYMKESTRKVRQWAIILVNNGMFV